MPSLFGNCKSAFLAKGVSELLLTLKVTFRLVQFVSVLEGNGVRDDMAVQVVSVLVDPDDALVTGEELAHEFLTDLENLRRCNRLVLMEADDVVCVHPTGVLVP